MTHYPEIRVRKVLSDDHKTDLWEVTEACQGPDDIVVHAGFKTDFASIPRWLWSIIPPHGRAANAAVLHDYRYIYCHEARETSDFRARMKADLYFYRDMLDAGVSNQQAWLMYQAVRWFGKKVWAQHKERLNQHA